MPSRTFGVASFGPVAANSLRVDLTWFVGRPLIADLQSLRAAESQPAPSQGLQDRVFDRLRSGQAVAWTTRHGRWAGPLPRFAAAVYRQACLTLDSDASDCSGGRIQRTVDPSAPQLPLALACWLPAQSPPLPPSLLLGRAR